ALVEAHAPVGRRQHIELLAAFGLARRGRGSGRLGGGEGRGQGGGGQQREDAGGKPPHRAASPTWLAAWRTTFIITLGKACAPSPPGAHHSPSASDAIPAATCNSRRKWVKTCSTDPGSSLQAMAAGAAARASSRLQAAARQGVEGISIIP